MVFRFRGKISSAPAQRQGADQRGAVFAGKRANAVQEFAIETFERCGSAQNDSVGLIRAVRMDSGRKPGFTCESVQRLRISRPAAMTSSTARATSLVTSALRSRRIPETVDARAGFQRFSEIGARKMERGSESKNNSGENCQRGRETKHAPVNSKVGKAGQIGRKRRFEQREPVHCEKQAERCPDHGDQRTFGEQLANHALASGAQHGTNRKFPFARGGAEKHQIRDVGASDQQHERDGSEQNEHASAFVADHSILQADYRDVGIPCGRHRPRK